MELHDIRAELSIKTIEFEQALEAGLSHSDLNKIYKELKELQYQRLMAELQQRESLSNEFLE